MGLFSSKYKTTVATTVTRAVEDKALPNSIRKGAMQSLMLHDDQMIENAMDELISGIGLRANRFYEYAKRSYAHGLPTADTHKTQDSTAVVKAQIEASVGGPIVIDYLHHGAFNNLHYGWVKLVQSYGYSTVTNQLATLTAAKGFPVYLQDMVVVVADITLAETQNGSLAAWGIPPKAGPSPDRPVQTWATGKFQRFSDIRVDAAVTSDYLRVHYAWINASGVVQTEYTDITIAAIDDSAVYYQVKYFKDGVAGYWLYEDNSGGNLTIDALFDPQYNNTGSYFPWMYFRHNKANPSLDKTTNEYKTSVKLGRYLSLDYQELVDAVHENPNIGQVEQALLMMAVPANTTNQIEMRYLFDYFTSLYATLGGELKPLVKKSEFWSRLDSSLMDGTIIIQDKKFKMGLGFRNIFITRKPGVIGAVGVYASGRGNELQITEVKDINTNVAKTTSTEVAYHYYRKQITATVYEEVRITNLRAVYHILDGYKVIADETDDILLIPVDSSITDNYSIADREVLLTRSLHYVFNSVVITEIKWYQQSWFKAILIIVAVIITYLTYGSTIKLLIAAIAIGTVAAVMAILWVLLLQLLRQLVISYLVKLFVKAVGIKFALIVALVAIIYGGYQAIEAGSIEGAPWASELLALSSNISAGVQTEVASEFDLLRKEYESFDVFVKEQDKKLKDAQALLDDGYRVNPIFIIGETPQEYFNRTVHSGNIGVLAIDAVSSYYDIALSLPTLKETLGDE